MEDILIKHHISQCCQLSSLGLSTRVWEVHPPRRTTAKSGHPLGPFEISYRIGLNLNPSDPIGFSFHFGQYV